MINGKWTPNILITNIALLSASYGGIQISGATNDSIAINWEAQGVLQSSSNLSEWKDLRAASSPHAIPPTSSNEFYRLRAPDFTVFSGYSNNTDVVVVDYEKNLVHQWTNESPGTATYVFSDGSMIRAARHGDSPLNGGGSGGRFEKKAWNGDTLWSFDYSSATNRAHHDFVVMPNGNLLAIAWEMLAWESAVAEGRDPDLVRKNKGFWPDTIIEIQPVGPNSGNIVWKWRAMDHIIQDFDPTKPNYGVVADHPERINLNHPPQARADWLHFNGIDYNAELDQIVVSPRSFNEIWIIDHSTTTEQAAGHTGGSRGRGGDLLYRWGNPAAYDRGDATDQVLGGQHNPTWIPAGYPGEGNLLLLNNGTHRGYSSADEITPPLNASGSYDVVPNGAFGPTNLTWTSTNAFFASFVSGAQRLPSGNTLICDGPSRVFFEVDENGVIVWEYIPPVGEAAVFRAERVFLTPPEQ